MELGLLCWVGGTLAEIRREPMFLELRKHMMGLWRFWKTLRSWGLLKVRLGWSSGYTDSALLSCRSICVVRVDMRILNNSGNVAGATCGLGMKQVDSKMVVRLGLYWKYFCSLSC